MVVVFQSVGQGRAFCLIVNAFKCQRLQFKSDKLLVGLVVVLGSARFCLIFKNGCIHCSEMLLIGSLRVLEGCYCCIPVEGPLRMPTGVCFIIHRRQFKLPGLHMNTRSDIVVESL